MSLTQNDLQEIRSIVRTEVQDIVRSEVRSEVHSAIVPLDKKLDAIAGRVETLKNDVKEIYKMLSELLKNQQSTNKFLKLSLQDKILKTYKELILTAKQAGVVLPRG